MKNMTTAEIKEEHFKLLSRSTQMDDIHFSLAIEEDCKISQLGFPIDTEFNSALLIINVLDKTFVRGNIQNCKVEHSDIPFLNEQEQFYMTYKIKNNDFKKMYLCSENFQAVASKEALYIPNEADYCTSILFYLDFGQYEQLIVIDPFNISGHLSMVKSSNGMLCTIIKNLLLTNKVIDHNTYKNITVGSSNEEQL